jgi:phenylalanyl-tRNA synthetase beta chain
MEKHPDADRLRVAQCNIGQETLQIVTAAQNVQTGHRIPLSVHGAMVMKGGTPTKIEKGKLRGVVSNGMMCSAEELGISAKDLPQEQREGVLILPSDTEPGADVIKLFGIDDEVLVIEPFANRPDYLSIHGIAREVAAALGLPLKPLDVAFPESEEVTTSLCKVTVADPHQCPRYTARIIREVSTAPSPLWLQGRLASAGVRAINRVVDVTNYVMLETGQPLHAFDYDKLEGHEIHVRQAHAGERIKTIDGDERTLSDSMLVIADQVRPIAVAGVMGGLDSEVTAETRTVLLEAANFNPVSVRRTGQALAMRSESSKRFEKGLSWEGVGTGSLRACALLAKLGGRVTHGVVEAGHGAPVPVHIEFRPSAVDAVLGVHIDRQTITAKLGLLGFTVRSDASDRAAVIVPSHRLDVKREIDLVEEVARQYGYDNIPSTLPGGRFAGQASEIDLAEEAVRDTLARLDMFEAITLALYRKGARQEIGLEDKSEIEVHNPLSEEQRSLRSTLMVHLLEAARHNMRARQKAVRLFELSRVYLPAAPNAPLQPHTPPGIRQERRLGLLWWPSDFFDAKGCLEVLAGSRGVKLQVEPEIFAGFHPGKSGRIVVNGVACGRIGVLHPQMALNFEIEGELVLAELDAGPLLAEKIGRTYQPVARFPASERDLAVIFEEHFPWARVEETVWKSGGPLLRSVSCFDVYRGESIGSGKKSLAFRMTFQALDRTLTDAEIDSVCKNIIGALEAHLGGHLRGAVGV